MHKFLFMVLVFFVCTVSLSLSAELTHSTEEDIVDDPFLDHVRWERGADYSTGVGGPVAAGPPGPGIDYDDDNATYTDECPADNSTSQPEIVKDSSNSQCGFEKRTGQVLSSAENAKPLKTVVCNSEADCIRQCDSVQCTYFTHNVRDKKMSLAFMYQLDEDTLHGAQFSPSDIFESYVRVCQPAGSQSRHARDDPLPPSRFPASSMQSDPVERDQRPGSGEVSLPRKRPRGSSGSSSSSATFRSSIQPASQTSPTDPKHHSRERSLPRKRPHGSSVSVSESSSSQSDSSRQFTSESRNSNTKSGVVSLPRKRPPGSPMVSSSGSSGPKIKNPTGPRITNPTISPLTNPTRPKMPNPPVTVPPKSGGDDSYKKFMEEYAKKHPKERPKQRDPQREKVFRSNLRLIEQLNAAREKVAGKDGAVYGITTFTDLTRAEFLKSFTGALPESQPAKKVPLGEHDLDDNVKKRPTLLDWHEQGKMGRVRYQGGCGSCYAFTSADLISAQNAIDRGERPKTLSAQSIADCYSDGAGCNGARVGKVLWNVAKDKNGVPLEQCYQYQEKNQTCQRANLSCCISQNIKWSELVDVSGPKEKDLMAALLQWGPVISIVGASEAWQFYNGSGIIKATQCTPGQQDHAVLVTGYNYGDSTPYYLVKNSWGKDWGERGYARLEAGQNACMVATSVYTACAQNCDKDKDAKSRMMRPPYSE